MEVNPSPQSTDSLNKKTKALIIAAIALSAIILILLAIFLVQQVANQNQSPGSSQENNGQNTNFPPQFGENPDETQQQPSSKYDGEEISLQLPPNWQMNMEPNQGSFATASTLRTICGSFDFKKGTAGDNNLEAIINQAYGKNISLDNEAKSKYTVAGKETLTVQGQVPGEVYSVFFKTDSQYYRIIYSAYTPQGPGDDRASDCSESYPTTDFDKLLQSIQFK